MDPLWQTGLFPVGTAWPLHVSGRSKETERNNYWTERDVTMAINQQTLKGNWNEIKGKLRTRWGHLSGDELESAHGNVEQLMGVIQQRTGEARETIENYLGELTTNGGSMAARASEAACGYAQTAQDSVREAATNTAQAIRAGTMRAERVVHERPLESLAVCFGAGLISGVVVGLALRSR